MEDLWLVTAMVYKTYYMLDTETYQVIRLVKAKTAKQAKEAFTKFYEEQSSSYSVEYKVDECDATNVIDGIIP